MLKKGSLNKTKSQRTESEIKSAIMSWLRLQPNTFVWVNHTTGIPDGKGGFRKNFNRGISDICGIKCGKGFAIEVKREKAMIPTTEQQRFLNNFRDAGGFILVASSLDDVMWAWDQV